MFKYRGRAYSIISIIPARGGSKGIKYKNIRYINGRPLIYYPIKISRESKYIDKVFVTSDDVLILKIAKIFGAETIKRPNALAKDNVPLDPVIYHAVSTIEKEYNFMPDIVITLQPTVPLLHPQDIDSAIEKLIIDGYDTVVFGVNATHLYWINKNNSWRQLFNVRKNRQELPQIVREIGVIITWRKFISENSRFGTKIYIHEVPETKGIDIDTYTDMLIVQSLLNRFKIMFIVNGKRETGLGHIYRVLTIAEMFHGYEKIFITNGELGKQLIEKWGYMAILDKNYDRIIEYVKNFTPKLIINDILDTTVGYMESIRRVSNAIIVNFEDLGEGTRLADLVFNALYEFSSPPPNHYYGYKYFILRDEFRLFPIKKYSEDIDVRRITILFGGTDPNNLTMKTLKAIKKYGLKNIEYRVIVGPGYKYISSLIKLVRELKNSGYNIKLYQDLHFLADLIYSSDIAITSNGRTLYEITSFAIPSISIAQNYRELRHPFAYLNKGIKFLGLASNINEDDIGEAIIDLINDKNNLVKNNIILQSYAIDIRKGKKRVIRIILDKIYEMEDEYIGNI